MEHVELLEHILHGRKKPVDLPFAILKNITDNFSEEREIGQGGFATVYKGVLPNGIVAVKRIKSSHSIDQRLFYRELDSLLTINHENIVRFLGFCASTNETAIKIEGSKRHIYAEVRERLFCLEYVNNGSLQKYITDELRGLEWDVRYRIIRGICEGLHHLHKEKQIYHMDLKPANILLDSHMVPKIADFGLSRFDEKSQTMSEYRFGTPGYCAPEYMHGGKMSFRSDIYSLGVIIIELVTGEKGIPDNNSNNVLRRWRHRWKKSGKETPLVYKQVAKCMEIGLLCKQSDPSKRPFIWDLIHDIREMEGVDGTISSAYEYASGQISPYSEDDMLGVEPLELHYRFELNKQISSSLKLTNPTDVYIAFDIQNMNPLTYCVQPNKGIVPPRSGCSVDVTLHLRDKAPRDMPRADELTVWSAKVNDGLAAEDITIDMLRKVSGVVDTMNLSVVFDAEEGTNVRKELIQRSITEDLSNNEIDGKVGGGKKCPEGISSMLLSGSSTGNQNRQEAENEFGELQEESDKTSGEILYQSNMGARTPGAYESSHHSHGVSSSGRGSSSRTLNQQIAADFGYARQLQEMEDLTIETPLDDDKQDDIGCLSSPSDTDNGHDKEEAARQVDKNDDDVDPESMTNEQRRKLVESKRYKSIGLSDEHLANLKIWKYTPRKADCPVCLSDFEDQASIITLPCHHSFHVSCITGFFKFSKTCPMCRHVLGPS